MTIKKYKSEHGGSRTAVSAPPIRKNSSPASKPTRPQSSKDHYKYEYFTIDDRDEPVKVMVPNLLLNKQNRLVTARHQAKRAVTAGFSRPHTNGTSMTAWGAVALKAPDDIVAAEIPPIAIRNSIVVKNASRKNSGSFNPREERDNPLISIDRASRTSRSNSSGSDLFSIDSRFSTDSRRTSTFSTSSKDGRKKSIRMSFKTAGPVDSLSPFLDSHLQAQDGGNGRFRRSRLKNILKVLVDPLESKLRQKEEKLTDNIVRRFKLKGMPMDRKIVERGLLHPPNLKKEQEMTQRNENGQEFTKSGEPGIVYRRKEKVLKKRSESTHLLHITALVVEPKDDAYSGRFKEIHRNEVSTTEPTKSLVKPKTNTWWTRAEYQAFHDNIADFRRRKHLEKEKGVLEKSHLFLPFAAINEPTSNSIARKKYVDNSNETSFRRTLWQDNSQNRDPANIKGTATLFARSSVFQQNSGRLSRQSQVSSEATSLKLSYHLYKSDVSAKVQKADYLEVSFI